MGKDLDNSYVGCRCKRNRVIMSVREIMRDGQGEGKEYVRGPKSENKGIGKRKDRVGTGMKEADSLRGTRLHMETVKCQAEKVK